MVLLLLLPTARIHFENASGPTRKESRAERGRAFDPRTTRPSACGIGEPHCWRRSARPLLANRPIDVSEEAKKRSESPPGGCMYKGKGYDHSSFKSPTVDFSNPTPNRTHYGRSVGLFEGIPILETARVILDFFCGDRMRASRNTRLALPDTLHLLSLYSV